MSASTTLGARSAVSSDHANGTPLSLMFPLSSFLSSPILHDRQYRRDWQMHTSPSLGTVSGQLPASAGGSAHHQLHSPRARALGANHPDGRNPTSPTNNQRLPPPWPGVASELPWPRSAHPNEQPMSSQLLQFESDPPFLNWPLAPDVDGVDFDHLGVHDSLVRSSGGGSVGMGPELLDPPFLTDAGRSQTGTDTTGDSQLAIMSDSAMFGLGSDDTAAAVAAAPTSQGADTHDDSGFLTTTMMMSPPISGTGGMFSVPGGTHAEAPMLGGVSLWSVEDGLTGSPESRVDCVPAPTVLCVPTPPPAPSNGERWTEIELSFTPLLDISTVMDAMRERDVVGWAATTPFLPTPLASPHPHQLTTAAPHHLMARHFNGPAAHQAQSADDGGENGGFLPQGQVDGATHEDDPELHWLTSRSESLLRENTSAIFDTVAEIAAQTPIDTQLLGAFCAPGP
ncbi:hypothetical protein BC828DRAFT_78668 [Blastocladiella britannica]|nr:hypothetical protein BC828DRAFT_78668 [Blastocladiella britannica]